MNSSILSPFFSSLPFKQVDLTPSLGFVHTAKIALKFVPPHGVLSWEDSHQRPITPSPTVFRTPESAHVIRCANNENEPMRVAPYMALLLLLPSLTHKV